MPGRLVFNTTADGSDQITERLRIDSSGRLLVGLTDNVDGSQTQINFSATLNRGSNATAVDANIGVLKFADLRSNSAYGEIRCQSDGTPGTDDYPGRMIFSTTADGASSVTERLRIDSSGRLKIGTISDYSAGVTNAPVYIAMQSDITGVGDDEGDTTAGMVRIEETGSNDGRYHGIELRNKNSGDIRIFNSDRSTLDRGDLILVMPDEDASDGTHLKMRVNSLQSSIQISGKGGAVAANTATQHTDIYIATKTGVTAVDTGVGGEIAGLVRFEDVGTNNSRYHGIELRNRNSGDIRILNQDTGTTNEADMVFAIDNGGVTEAMRIRGANGFIGANHPVPSAPLTVGRSNTGTSGLVGFLKLRQRNGTNGNRASILFSSLDDYDVAGINGVIETHSGTLSNNKGRLEFHTKNSGSNITERMRINAGGTVNIPDGITLGTAIDSTAAGNTLHDYEEGTFTATCANSVTLHSDTNLLQYVKIGASVTVMGQIRVNSSNSGSSLTISNAPFTVSSSGEGSAFAVGAVRLYAADMASDHKYVIVVADGGSTNLQFQGVRDNAQSQGLGATDNGYYMFSVTYRTTA